ncbi:MAG: transglutaminase domain-containing protein, partial [Lachnospiraceae bacterium]|nr:transglutaminase domain-containing protein [Lachnospiraceae bacterium]
PYSAALFLAGMLLAGCSAVADPPVSNPGTQTSPSVSEDTPGTSGGNGSESSDNGKEESSAESQAPVKGSRDNSVRCLVPTADGTLVAESETYSIDYSHTEDGYVCVKYCGPIDIIKLRITGPDEVVYTYDLRTKDYEVFPLTGGNGDYTVAIYENIEGTQYALAASEVIGVQITDELTPYLYPNQYVDFTKDSKAVKLASELVYSANDDLDAVSLIYNYIIDNITYDTPKAESKPTNYVPDIDEILDAKTGICLDYASLMCSMLRSQQIPARLEIGYAADAYHAWISVYIDGVGWVNGVVEFTGDKWTLMDPTFGASAEDTTLKKFIGDGSNYTLQKIY